MIRDSFQYLILNLIVITASLAPLSEVIVLDHHQGVVSPSLGHVARLSELVSGDVILQNAVIRDSDRLFAT